MLSLLHTKGVTAFSFSHPGSGKIGLRRPACLRLRVCCYDYGRFSLTAATTLFSPGAHPSMVSMLTQ